MAARLPVGSFFTAVFPDPEETRTAINEHADCIEALQRQIDELLTVVDCLVRKAANGAA